MCLTFSEKDIKMFFAVIVISALSVNYSSVWNIQDSFFKQKMLKCIG